MAEVILEFLTIAIASSAFTVALYTFFGKESRLRESANYLLWVIFIFGLSTLISIGSLLFSILNMQAYAISCLSAGIIVYIFGWGGFLFTFWKIYGRMYHMREKRFAKYVFPLRFFYNLIEKRYATTMRERRSFSLLPYDFDKEDQRIINKGYTFLFISDNSQIARRKAMEVLVNGLEEDETADYVCCERPPYQIWQEFKTFYPQVVRYTKNITLIDAYSPNFWFDDEIQREKLKEIGGGTVGSEGIRIIRARTVAAIHTASNTSWYMNKKQLEKSGGGLRKPHRTVYDTASTLAIFSGLEQIKTYFYHCLASEKSYGMITVIVEPASENKELIEFLSRLVDCVIEFKVKNGRNFVKMIKADGLDFAKYLEETEC